MELRTYQKEAADAIDIYVSTESGNPCAVLSTGAGKSLLIAELVHRWKAAYPPFRCIVLQHRKELVQQNSAELLEVFPDADLGIYSAGLNRHDVGHTITYAGIDSVYKKGSEFPVHCIIVDEAHRIQIKGEGKYRTFIKGVQSVSPGVRVVGVTATPYRLDSGPIVDKDFILNEIVYETDTRRLIEEGYLSRLDSVLGSERPDTKGIHKVNGDFNQKELGKRVCDDVLIHNTVTDALSILNSRNRKRVIWFCVNIEHCKKVTDELEAVGETCACITGKTPSKERSELIERFRDGEFRHLCNVNVFTEGFNVKQVDGICLLRPTLSKGLYQQMVGRGLRVHPDKDYCAVLDYANCIAEHGPLADSGGEEAPHIDCPECRSYFAKALGCCPTCGWKVPAQQEHEKSDNDSSSGVYVRRMHTDQCSSVDILGMKPTDMPVNEVLVSKHTKEGKAPTLRVTYHCGLIPVYEWISLEGTGYARHMAEKWWNAIVGADCPYSVDEALEYPYLESIIQNSVKSLLVTGEGKYYKILKRNLTNGKHC